MTKKLFVFGIITSFLIGIGCESTPTEKPMSSLAIQAFQKKEFETPKKIAFSSVISVLQDLGYIIKSADFNTGLITGNSPTKSESTGFMTEVSHMSNTGVTAFVEEFGTNRSSIRLNFVAVKESSSETGMKSRVDKPVLDPLVYQNSFAKIQEAIFIREGFK